MKMKSKPKMYNAVTIEKDLSIKIESTTNIKSKKLTRIINVVEIGPIYLNKNKTFY